MEQSFQTSFIPKKPMVEQKVVARRPVGLLVVLAIFIFLAMVLFSGGAYLYQINLNKNLTQMKEDLNLAQKRFEPEKISQMKNLDRRLQASSEVLSKHIVISPIFQTLEDITLKTIRYTEFNYALTEDDKVSVKIKGQGIGYRSVALQADLLAQNKNFIDPVFSGLSLDEKGNVIFDLSFLVDPTFVNYQQFLKRTEKTTAEIINNPILE